MSTTWSVLSADLHRQYGRSSALLFFKALVTLRTYRAVATLRLCQTASRSTGLLRLTLPVLKLVHRITCHLATIELPWRTRIGPGIALTHGFGLVVNEGTQIGSNVTLFHGVTLGRRDRIADNGARVTEYPVIEDEVWIGPHALIVGGVTIGRGSRIAGGAFVTESIPPACVVQGNPAVVVKRNCVPDVMNRVER